MATLAGSDEGVATSGAGLLRRPLLALTAWSQTPAEAPLIPLETFAAGAEMEQPRISPDGTHLAYIATIQGERALLMRDLQGKEAAPGP